MNILYICDEYPPGRHGGIGTAVQLLARAVAMQGHMVIVAGFYDWNYGQKDEETDAGVKVFRFRRKLSSSIYGKPDSLIQKLIYKLFTETGVFQLDIQHSIKEYCTFLNNLIKQYQIDIVEMPDYHDYMRFCKRPVFLPFPNAPTVIKCHGSMTYFLKEDEKPVPNTIFTMEKDMFEKAEAVASVSKYTAEKTALYFDYKKPVTVLYNGINIPRHYQETAKHKNKVIFSGSLVKKKGIFQLAKAWNIVSQKISDAELFIFGKGPKEKVAALLSGSAAKKVFFGGHIKREELMHHIAESAVAVFPSYAECFALAPMEAMAIGTATIYTTRSSGPELVTDGENGAVVDPDKINELADKIVALLTKDDKRDLLAANGKKHIARNFDIKLIAQKNIEFYSNILGK